jgi:UDP-N-acetyl-D-mannosaminuronic acid dehydrogenase
MADVKVACLGLAFKPDIDDLRESPAVEIALVLAKLGCMVLAVEPNIAKLPDSLVVPNVALVSLDDALSVSDVACILVKHKQFSELNVSNQLTPTVFDAVGIREQRRSGM